MFTRLVRFLTQRGFIFLERKGIPVFIIPEAIKQSVQLQSDISVMNNLLSAKRLEIITVFDAFFIQMQNTYLTGLAKSDSTVQTTMTQHWAENLSKVTKLYQEHLDMATQLNQKLTELDKISEEIKRN